MIAGLATFVLLAHSLGPAPFGHIATAIAYCGFASIVSDYGLGIWAQRSASAEQERASEIVTDALIAKLALSTVIGLVGIVPVVVLGAGFFLYIMIFLGTIAAASADIAIVISRVNQRFDLEAKLVVGAGSLWLIIVGGVAWATRDVQASAIAFFVTRAGYFVACIGAVRRIAPINYPGIRFTRIKRTLGGSSRYAIDSILTSLTSQIDVLLFGAALSKESAGIYQAGSRLVQVIVPFAVVLSSVYLTPLTASFTQKKLGEYRGLSCRVTLEFLALAIAGGVALVVLGPIISDKLYGRAYAPLLAMWPAFAIFASQRFLAAGFGIQLVALGDIQIRIISQIASFIIFVAATWIFLPRYGLNAAPWLLALSAFPALLISGFSASRMGSKIAVFGSIATSMAFSTVLILFRTWGLL